jgi:predicted metal-dependent peptidase
MNMSNEPEVFAKSKIKMILKHPFFAVLALHLQEKNAGKELPTTATDGKSLFVNPEWAKKLDDDEKVFVLGHEVLHCALGHLWRRGTRDAERWNMAADYAINLILQKSGLKAPKDCLLDAKYDGMSAEEIYDAMPKDMKGKKPLCVFLKGNGGGDGSPDGKGCQGEGDGHAHGGDIEIDAPSAKEMETEWKGLLAEAATAAKMQGKMPAGMDRMIGDILEPKMRWDQLLDQLISEVTRDDYDDQYPDRRLLHEHGLYFPDLKSEKRYVAIAFDTSGSIGQEDLQAFAGETTAIIRSRGVSRIRLMSCDAAVHLDKMIEPQDELPAEFPGGGGTSFVPVFKRLEEDQEKPALLVYFTDAYGTFPENPPEYPVMWVVKGGSTKEVPFGLSCDYATSEIEVR